jgi:hypothetical protein
LWSIAQVPETNPDFFRTKNWYFGEGIGLTFNSDTILVDTSFVGFNYEGTAILNDLEGKLKYYCDGRFLYDKNHQIVNSSEWLRADNSSCQGIILSESPNNSKLVNILTTTPTYSTQRSGYRYTLYDESLDSFIFINKILIKDVGEKQNSTNHLNNMATWITTHSLLGNLFYSFLLKDEELICCPRITKIGESYTDRNPSQGVLKFSSSGVKVFNANWTLLNFELLSFDKENGILFDSIKVPLFAPSVGEFSHDEKVLFVIDRGQSLFLYRVQDIENMIMDPFDTLVTYKPLEFKISQPQLAMVPYILQNIRIQFYQK